MTPLATYFGKTGGSGKEQGAIEGKAQARSIGRGPTLGLRALVLKVAR
jgi:hypothetical protein